MSHQLPKEGNTPRTDDFYDLRHGDALYEGQRVARNVTLDAAIDHARTLERELAAANGRLSDATQFRERALKEITRLTLARHDCVTYAVSLRQSLEWALDVAAIALNDRDAPDSEWDKLHVAEALIARDDPAPPTARHNAAPAGTPLVANGCHEIGVIQKALEFYASPRNWVNDTVDIGVGDQTIPESSAAANDRGYVAQQALSLAALASQPVHSIGVPIPEGWKLVPHQLDGEYLRDVCEHLWDTSEDDPILQLSGRRLADVYRLMLDLAPVVHSQGVDSK